MPFIVHEICTRVFGISINMHNPILLCCKSLVGSPRLSRGPRWEYYHNLALWELSRIAKDCTNETCFIIITLVPSLQLIMKVEWKEIMHSASKIQSLFISFCFKCTHAEVQAFYTSSCILYCCLYKDHERSGEINYVYLKINQKKR